MQIAQSRASSATTMYGYALTEILDNWVEGIAPQQRLIRAIN
jgi:hypothetical protein